MIPRIVIDSSDASTELCRIGRAAGTDKSPYNTVAHRHPYTAVYSMLFSSLKNKPIRFAEIGVAGGASALLWEIYFTHPNAELRMFDRDEEFLRRAHKHVGNRFTFALMDVSVDGDVFRALGNEPYDVILDDSSHDFEHQIRIIKEAWPLLKPGGMLIIEDIFRNESEERYAKALFEIEILESAVSTYFVVCEHKNRWSPGWDNDKLLVLVKG
jgi:predicted O-methyltransferase YrrM